VRFFLALILAALALDALAQAYPSRPVRVMVGFAPGGPNDIIARAYAARLGESFRPALRRREPHRRAGNLAAEAVARAASDGHTLMLGSTGTNAVNPTLYANLAFDLLRDLTPSRWSRPVPARSRCIRRCPPRAWVS